MMKKSLFISLMAAMLLLPQCLFAQNIKVMSYNIRTGEAKDGTNSWVLRYAATAEMIIDQKPDVFGVQEAMSYQIYFMEENLKDYKNVGVGRDNGKKEGEFMSIFWNKKTVSMLDWGTFWLSETPDVPSKGWDAACFRTATWALMKCRKTGKTFYFVNTHLDHEGKEAQQKGLQLIMDKIQEMHVKSLPVVLTGDFNVTPSDKALGCVDALMESARKSAIATDAIGTYNNWGKNSDIIDYIYFSGFSSCAEYQTVTKKYADRKYVSDHYPICARLIF